MLQFFCVVLLCHKSCAKMSNLVFHFTSTPYTVSPTCVTEHSFLSLYDHIILFTNVVKQTSVHFNFLVGSVHGSSFVRSIVKVFSKYARDKDVLSLLTKVRQIMKIVLLL